MEMFLHTLADFVHVIPASIRWCGVNNPIGTITFTNEA